MPGTEDDPVKLDLFQTITNVGWGGGWLGVYCYLVTGNNSVSAAGTSEVHIAGGNSAQSLKGGPIFPGTLSNPHDVSSSDLVEGVVSVWEHFVQGLSDLHSDNIQGFRVMRLGSGVLTVTVDLPLGQGIFSSQGTIGFISTELLTDQRIDMAVDRVGTPLPLENFKNFESGSERNESFIFEVDMGKKTISEL